MPNINPGGPNFQPRPQFKPKPELKPEVANGKVYYPKPKVEVHAFSPGGEKPNEPTLDDINDWLNSHPTSEKKTPPTDEKTPPPHTLDPEEKTPPESQLGSGLDVDGKKPPNNINTKA